MSPHATYTAWGWFWNLFGVTAHPIRITYICRHCGETIEVVDQNENLKNQE